MGYESSGKDSQKIISTLEAHYKGIHYYLNFGNPVELMVAAILSAQTRDTTVNAMTPALFKRYRSAKDYANSTPKFFQLQADLLSIAYKFLSA